MVGCPRKDPGHPFFLCLRPFPVYAPAAGSKKHYESHKRLSDSHFDRSLGVRSLIQRSNLQFYEHQLIAL